MKGEGEMPSVSGRGENPVLSHVNYVSSGREPGIHFVKMGVDN